MLIYSKTKAEFMDDMDNDLLVQELYDSILEKMHRKTAANEILSWKHSLLEMYKVLRTDVPDRFVRLFGEEPFA